MKIDKEFVLREIAGDYVLIPTGKTVMEFNGLATINEVGVFLWNKLIDGATEEELLQAVISEYDIDEATAKADIKEFLEILVAHKIIS